jgi:hypothetical protein
MGRKRSAKQNDTTTLEKARDELYSHILRCGVLQATPEHQKDWFDDTIEYLAERYPLLSDDEVADLRQLGERYCQPVIAREPTAGAAK